jgi:nucleotide-binding universal stress UspA family protein
MFSNILVATDGSDHASNALGIAIEMASKFAAKLTVVHVLTHDHPSEEVERMIEIEHMDSVHNPTVPVLTEDGSRISDTLAKRGMLRSGDREARVITIMGEQILKRAEHDANTAGVKDVTTKLLNGDYANSILAIADESNADIIVMGRRGLSTLQGFMTGSVSHKVAQRASCSVLTVK